MTAPSHSPARAKRSQVRASRPLHPSLYQLNTRVRLTELSRSLGRPAYRAG